MTASLTVTDQVLLDFAQEVGDAGTVAAVGSKTRWQLGGPVDEGARLVQAPSGIVAYVPDEMTVTVRAGTTVADLHTELAEKGQRTALPERGGTVGGAIAVGENSVHVLGRGRVREAALQVRYVSDDGAVITGGGPTVKNVTGFDLPRLMVGSLGTLGLFVEVILRTNPIPPCRRWVSSNDVDPFVVPDTVLRPSTVLWNGATTWVELEGYGEAVDAEHRRLGAIGSFDETEGPPELPEYRWSLPPAALRNTILGDGAWVASIGVGAAWATQPQPERPTDPVLVALSARVKGQFDPNGRFNPGRTPGAQ